MVKSCYYLNHILILWAKKNFKKRLTYSHLNRRIKQFKYKGYDAHMKPCPVNSEVPRLSDQAIQNESYKFNYGSMNSG